MSSIVDMRLKGAWMNPTLRAVLVAMRPWSIPASLVPSAVAALLVCDSVAQLPFAMLPIFTGLIAHLGANAINTVYDFRKGLDRAETADDRALVDGTIGERMLSFLAYACFLISGALGAYTVYNAGENKEPLAMLTATGFFLAYFYTAYPLSLKYQGLGDLTVFLCFGPILMMATAGSIIGKYPALVAWPLNSRLLQEKDEDGNLYDPPPVIAFPGREEWLNVWKYLDWSALGKYGPVMGMSIPIGMLVVAILHANNIRDIPMDRAAKARTPARIIGATWSKEIYYLYIFMSYVFAAFAARSWLASSWKYDVDGEELRKSFIGLGKKVIEQDWARLGELLVGVKPTSVLHGAASMKNPTACALHFLRFLAFLIIPTGAWSTALCNRMARNELATLPQATAQFGLLFGAALISGLLPLLATARLWLGVLFFLGGVNNLVMWQHTRLLVRYKLAVALGMLEGGIDPWFPQLLASFLALVSSVVQIAAATVFIVGINRWWTAASAFVLLAFVLPVTPVVHDMWNATHDGTQELRNPEAKSLEEYTATMGKQLNVAAPAPVAEAEAEASASSTEAELESKAQATPASGKKGGRRGSSSAAAGARHGSVSAASAAAPSPAARAAWAGQWAVPSGPEEVGKPVAKDKDGIALDYLEQGRVPTFLDPFSNEFVHFFKNCGMAGGLLLVLALSTSPLPSSMAA